MEAKYAVDTRLARRYQEFVTNQRRDEQIVLDFPPLFPQDGDDEEEDAETHAGSSEEEQEGKGDDVEGDEGFSSARRVLRFQ